MEQLFCGLDKGQGDFHIIDVKCGGVLDNRRNGTWREVLAKTGVYKLWPTDQIWITVCFHEGT